MVSRYKQWLSAQAVISLAGAWAGNGISNMVRNEITNKTESVGGCCENNDVMAV